jgi:hypothetical protein
LKKNNISKIEMTTVIAHNYDNIPYTSYANFKITGPLSNHNFPNFVKGPIDNKIMVGRRPNPSNFSPSDTGSTFAQGRVVYANTNTTQHNMQVGRNGGLTTANNDDFQISKMRAYPRHNFHAQLQCKKYIPPKSTSMYIYAKKNAAIGQSSLKGGGGVFNSLQPLSYGGIDRNDVKSALVRVRRHGGAAPPKASAIENKFRGASYWGAQARQGIYS